MMALRSGIESLASCRFSIARRPSCVAASAVVDIPLPSGMRFACPKGMVDSMHLGKLNLTGTWVCLACLEEMPAQMVISENTTLSCLRKSCGNFLSLTRGKAFDSVHANISSRMEQERNSDRMNRGKCLRTTRGRNLSVRCERDPA